MNNSGAVRRDYGQLLNDSPGQTQAGLIRPSQYGDFDQNYQAMASVGRSPGSYTADGGETLSDVARAVWGDAGLWYLIAGENGLKGTETLLAGTVLRLPNVNTNLHNAAGVNRPYEPGQAIGDVSPTLVDPPQPLKQKPKKKKRSGLGKLIATIITVVIVVVAIVTEVWGILEYIPTVWTEASKLDNTIDYSKGLITKEQAFKEVTVTAVASYAGGFVGGYAGGAVANAIGGASGSFLGHVTGMFVQGAVGSTVSQGVNIALGMQDSFSWKAVAVGGAANTAGSLAGSAMNSLTATGGALDFGWSETARQSISALTSSLVKEAVTSAIYGGNYSFNAAAFAGDLAQRFASTRQTWQSATEAQLDATRQRAENLAQPAYDPAQRPVLTEHSLLAFETAPALSVQAPAQGLAMNGTGIDSSLVRGALLDEVVVTARRETDINLLTPSSADILAGMHANDAFFRGMDAGNRDIDRTLNDLARQRETEQAMAYFEGLNGSQPGKPQASREGVASFLEGVFLGDFSDNDSWSALAGQFVGGLNPLADVRDTAAAIRQVWKGEEGGWLNLAAAGIGLVPLAGDGLKMAIKHGDDIVGAGGTLLRQVDGIATNSAAVRAEAAANIREARNLLKEAGVPLHDRNQIIRSFDLETFRIERTLATRTEFRVFDDFSAPLKGRYISSDFFESQTDRIINFALPNNAATRLGQVTIPEGSLVFTGRVAPQLNFGTGFVGGANQTFLMGPLRNYNFVEIPMPRP